jgi:hypothetical protein
MKTRSTPTLEAVAPATTCSASWFLNGAEYRKRNGYIEARNEINPDWVIVDTDESCDTLPTTCSALDLANGLRHAADDHECCKGTLNMAADAIIQMAQALNGLAAPLGRADYTVSKLDGIVREIAAEAVIFQQNETSPSVDATEKPML